jgi:hypothetical protein
VSFGDHSDFMPEQGELIPKEAASLDPLHDLNEARREAQKLALRAVCFLYDVIENTEEDTDRRIMAAAELLAFAKVP